MDDVIDTSELISRGLPDIAYIDNSHDLDPSAPKVLAVKRGESGYWPITNKSGLSAKDLNLSLIHI